jgi:hypothetical protein
MTVILRIKAQERPRFTFDYCLQFLCFISFRYLQTWSTRREFLLLACIKPFNFHFWFSLDVLALALSSSTWDSIGDGLAVFWIG